MGKPTGFLEYGRCENSTEIKRLEDLGFDHEEAQLRAFEAAHA